MGQIVGFLPSMWETWIELLAPSLDPAPLHVLWKFGI